VALNVINTLAGLKGEYRGAVFLTYTLDLLFFEEIVAPKLDALGCTNVVILAEQHGYHDALERGERYLTRVGRRYVCAPVVGTGQGVMHAKAILLVGREHGCLMVGSGNLTLHGLGRNLEHFYRFDLNPKENGSTASYPFSIVWKLIQQLATRSQITGTASDQLTVIGEHAPWLSQTVAPPANLRLCHSLDYPILAQWGGQTAVEELRLLSPFWNENVVAGLVERFQPRQLILGVNAARPRLDGALVQHQAESRHCHLELAAVSGRPDTHRELHAKTFIGTGPAGAWCVSGSANCTAAALEGSWRGGGNLELVVWQQSDDPAAFSHIWADPLLSLQRLEPATVHKPPEEQLPTLPVLPFRLRELRYENNQVKGQIVWAVSSDKDSLQSGTAFEIGHWFLELRLARQRHAIAPDKNGEFVLRMTAGLKQAEAGRVIWLPATGEKCHSLSLWVDQPAELARFGQRAYHARVETNLQTFAGAGQLFEELMNFLWNRVDPSQWQEQGTMAGAGRRRGSGSQEDSDDTTYREPPPPDAFFVEEELTDDALAVRIRRQVGRYWPHQQSVYSLRDLLSLALLRLTAETRPPDGQPEDSSEPPDGKRTDMDEAERESVLHHLCRYIKRYCRQYAQRLVKREFVEQVGPRLLFENHYTVGRILLEFYDKVDLFNDRDLRECLLLIFGALFWPKAANVEQPGGWALLAQAHELAYLQQLWRETGMVALMAVLMDAAWGKPPGWQVTVYDTALVQRYMLGRQLLNTIETAVGTKFWNVPSAPVVDSLDLFGFRQATDLERESDRVPLIDTAEHHRRLSLYQTPAEEKYIYLLAWWKLNNRGQEGTQNAQNLQRAILKLGQIAEFRLISQLGKRGRVAPLVGEMDHCPGCSIKLPFSLLTGVKNCELKLCPHCTRTALYWKPALNLQAL
jgi:hypothetical protein